MIILKILSDTQSGENAEELILKAAKLKHYRNAGHKKEYLKAIKNVLKKEKIVDLLFKLKIRMTKQSLEIYTDVADFLKKHESCIVFISVDNNQYSNFIRLVNIINVKTKIVKESSLKKGSLEYKLSLIIDNLLNIVRTRKQSK